MDRLAFWDGMKLYGSTAMHGVYTKQMTQYEA